MSEVNRVGEDLRFVREAVNRQGTGFNARCGAIYYIWAVYIAVGYALLDVSIRDANWFFATAWLPGVLGTLYVTRRWMKQRGEVDRQRARRAQLHWFTGSILCVLAAFGLAATQPSLRGIHAGQIEVVLFGLLWFTAGVHLDRFFLILGPLLMLGGVFVGFVPHYGWTALGTLAGLALIAAGLISSYRQASPSNAE